MFRLLLLTVLVALTQPAYADGSKKAHAHRHVKRLVYKGPSSQDGLLFNGWLPLNQDQLRDSVVVVRGIESSTCSRILKLLSKNNVPTLWSSNRGYGIFVWRQDKEKATHLIQEDAKRAGYFWLP